MKFYTWHGKVEKLFEKEIEVFHLDIGKWWIEFTIFNFYFGIGIIFGGVKIKGKLK